MTLAVLLGLGAAGTGTRIAALVSSQQNAHNYHLLNEAISQDIENIKRGLDDLTDSLVSLSEVALQNRRGLDLLFLQQGGLCAALKKECCVYVDKTGLVKDSIAKVTASLEKRKREREQQESWYQNWFSTSPWLSTLLPSLLGPLLGLLLLISFGPWAFQKLTRFVKSQIDSSQVHLFQFITISWTLVIASRLLEKSRTWIPLHHPLLGERDSISIKCLSKIIPLPLNSAIILMPGIIYRLP